MLSQSRVNSLVAGLVVAFVTSSALGQCGAKGIEKSAVKKVVKVVMGGEEGCSGATVKSAALEEPCCPGCFPGCCPECPIGCCAEAAGDKAIKKVIKVVGAGEDWYPGASARAAISEEPCCPECAPGCCPECPIGCCAEAAGGEAGEKMIKVMIAGEEDCPGASAKAAALKEPCCPECAPGCCAECPIGCCSKAAGGRGIKKVIKVVGAGEDWCPGASAKAAALKEPCCAGCSPGCCPECPIGCCSKAAGGKVIKKVIKKVIGAGEECCPGASAEKVIVKKHRRLKTPAGHCGCGGSCAGRSHKHEHKHKHE